MKIFGSSKGVPAAYNNTPEEEGISERAKVLFQKTHCKEETPPPGTPSYQKRGRCWYQRKAYIPPRPVTDICARTQALVGLVDEVGQFEKESDLFKQEMQAQYNKLSIFKPSTWKALFRELVDKVIIFFFGPIFSFGKFVSAKARVEELQEHVQDKVAFFQDREYAALQNFAKDREKERQSLEAYALVDALNPKDLRASKAFAKTLVQEEAFGPALEVLEPYTKTKPVDLEARIFYVTALKGKREFEKARNEIEALEEQVSDAQIDTLKILKADCLVALRSYSDAAITLHSVDEKTDSVIRKILYLQVAEALEKGAKNDALDSCKRTYVLLDSQKRDVLSGNSLKVDFEFFLDMLFTQKDVKKETFDRIVEKLIVQAKELATNMAFELIERELQAIEQESAALSSTASPAGMTICDVIQNALNNVEEKKRAEKKSGSDLPFETRGLAHKKQVLEALVAKLQETKEYKGEKLSAIITRIQNLGPILS